jgi:hypothetical protein
MHYIVCPVRPASEGQPDGSQLINDRIARDALKVFDIDEGLANQRAERLAAKYPQVQFGVFAIKSICETLAPAPPKVIHKKLNENGEVVLA